MRVAVIYDLLIGKGGAERVVLALARAFDADIWTTTYVPEAVYPEYGAFRIFPHPLKSWPLSSRMKLMSLLWQGLIQTEAIFKFRKMELPGYKIMLYHIKKGMSRIICIYFLTSLAIFFSLSVGMKNISPSLHFKSVSFSSLLS